MYRTWMRPCREWWAPDRPAASPSRHRPRSPDDDQDFTYVQMSRGHIPWEQITTILWASLLALAQPKVSRWRNHVWHAWTLDKTHVIWNVIVSTWSLKRHWGIGISTCSSHHMRLCLHAKALWVNMNFMPTCHTKNGTCCITICPWWTAICCVWKHGASFAEHIMHDLMNIKLYIHCMF